MYYTTKEERFVANKKTRPCVCCGASFKPNTLAVRVSESRFSYDDGVTKVRHNICPKCLHKTKERNARADIRRERAKRGECEMAKIETYSWSDGTLYGGECQKRCYECNLYCTFGEVGTF